MCGNFQRSEWGDEMFVTLIDAASGKEASVNLRLVFTMAVDDKGITQLTTDCGSKIRVNESPAAILYQWRNAGSKEVLRVGANKPIEKFRCTEDIQRIAELEAELAALKAQSQEVPPLDRWRVLATAVRELRKYSDATGPGDSGAIGRKKRAFALAADAIETANGGTIGQDSYEVE